MFNNSHIPVLTDLIEKGIEIRLSELGLDELVLDHNDDLILETDDREEPHIDAIQLEAEVDAELKAKIEPTSHALSNNPALEQTIRRILNEHMELALQDIKLAISQADKNEDE
jgi:hypothetical protein